MIHLTTATLSWFNDGCCDVKYLDIWDNAPISYVPGQTPVDHSWYVDTYEEIVARHAQRHTFRRLRNLLLTYQFPPPSLMSTATDFGREERLMRVGDRIVQRHHLFHIATYSLLDVIGLTEVYAVQDDPQYVAFTTVTVAPHVTQGEWNIAATWHNNGDITLKVYAVSRPVPAEPVRNHTFLRNRQQVARHLCMAHLKQLLHAPPSK